MTQLGRLEKVDLRTVWTNEAYDFTPWLAKEENMALLGETIGLELEVESTEEPVGSFSADMYCKNTVDNSWVVIENQFGLTDHKHLGQLLTYAAGLDAVTIIWIAERFKEEHRAALDMLNEKTSDNVNFFGLEIELWRIGKSDMAPKFNMISKPNDWSRTVKSTAGKELTPTTKLHLEYWTAFREYMQESKSFINCPRPYPQNFTNFALGRSRFLLCAKVNTLEKEIGVLFIVHGENKAEYFRILQYKYKPLIEENLNMDLNWREDPRAKESKILTGLKSNPFDRDDWQHQHMWIKETLEKMHKVLSPIIKKLNLSELNDIKEDEI